MHGQLPRCTAAGLALLQAKHCPRCRSAPTYSTMRLFLPKPYCNRGRGRRRAACRSAMCAARQDCAEALLCIARCISLPAASSALPSPHAPVTKAGIGVTHEPWTKHRPSNINRTHGPRRVASQMDTRAHLCPPPPPALAPTHHVRVAVGGAARAVDDEQLAQRECQRGSQGLD